LFAATHRAIDYSSDWFLKATQTGGNLGPLLERCPTLRPLLILVLDLIGADYRTITLDGVVAPLDDADRVDQAVLIEPAAALSLGMDPTPEMTQSRIAAD
jgi:hypothetical protein